MIRHRAAFRGEVVDSYLGLTFIDSQRLEYLIEKR